MVRVGFRGSGEGSVGGNDEGRMQGGSGEGGVSGGSNECRG